MLYPQNNPHRQFVDLSGFWDFRFDEANEGMLDEWWQGFRGAQPIAVPASWNDQFAENRDFLGPAWYQTRFNLPWGFEGGRVFLRFNSVNYLAEAWLNGTPLGQHEGGHLPFQFDITSQVQPADNLLVVRVDGSLAFDRVPPGNVTGDEADFFGNNAQNYPQTQFDFFPFCGIQRPVLLCSLPDEAIQDVTVAVGLDRGTGLVKVRLQAQVKSAAMLRLHLSGNGIDRSLSAPLKNGIAEADLEIPDALLWEPGAPNLYQLRLDLLRDHQVLDQYSLPVGIRTVTVKDNQLLLNGKPIVLRGFGRHEDFPVLGRGLCEPVIIKDYALMHWVGANSFRTTHYPYSEQMLDMADRLGFLVIAETPAVGLYFTAKGLPRRLQLCQQYTREMIDRDKNHPSVIMWSVANEPHSNRPEAEPFFQTLCQLAKALDPSRPVTLVSTVGLLEESFKHCDVLCLNRYYGWYSQTGRVEEGAEFLARELDALYERYRKPILLTEFGADTLPGFHAQPPELFSEEYQVEFIKTYLRVLESKDYVVGHHIWNLCDFKTSQSIVRTNGMNHKGVFTRDRRPKMAAHYLRQHWRK